MKKLLLLLLAVTSLFAQWQMTPVKDGAYLYNTETGRTFICKDKNEVILANGPVEMQNHSCKSVKFHHNFMNKYRNIEHTQSMLPIKADR